MEAGGRARETKPLSVQVYLAVEWVPLSSLAYLWACLPCARSMASEVQDAQAHGEGGRGRGRAFPGSAAAGVWRGALP